MVMPLVKAFILICSHQKIRFIIMIFILQVFCRIICEALSSPVQFKSINNKTFIPGNCLLYHGSTLFVAGRLGFLVWRLSRRDEDHPVQTESNFNFQYRNDMSYMNRVKGPAKNAYLHDSSC